MLCIKNIFIEFKYNYQDFIYENYFKTVTNLTFFCSIIKHYMAKEKVLGANPDKTQSWYCSQGNTKFNAFLASYI